ncbi:hypothetical protein [uncultured Jannaschia sp.]|uniref:hypothetical protein n=1 Tax=uncultured Jannaschia sp. TaxID=293347 RepID=UPI002638A5B6|nr:hypothetical protein [uncultured Jannaschia sp.]
MPGSTPSAARDGDAFYTRAATAALCLDHLRKTVSLEDIALLLEPSARGGGGHLPTIEKCGRRGRRPG